MATASWESELTSLQHSLRFVLKLKQEFVCPVCGGVVLDPQQNSCGHIYCLRCLRHLLGGSSPSRPVCPVDGAGIAPDEVFQDNCCKREISGLEVFCPNSPACAAVVTLSQLPDHLRSCRFELLPCTSVLERRRLQEHAHVLSSCPDVEVDCPHGCSRKVPRLTLDEHSASCPEGPVDCSFRGVGCSLQDKRREVKLHEHAAFGHHSLLVMRSDASLEQQVEALLRRQEVHVESSVLAGRQNEVGALLQQSSGHEHVVSVLQRTVDRHEDVLSTVTLDLQQVSVGLGSGLEELQQLRKSLQAVIQEVSAVEALREKLGTLEEKLRRQSCLLDQHTAQLSHSKQHLTELEATSYDGKMIWKIQDVRRRREVDAGGLASVPFHAGRCGYKMAARAYLHGDGDGRGTHLSLYVVLLPGDFDALLPWPFGHTVCLSVLDQSGAGRHRSLSFRPDPAARSFRQPSADDSVAVGFSRFLPLDKLDAFVKDDTLFVKVKVDTSGLEQLPHACCQATASFGTSSAP